MTINFFELYFQKIQDVHIVILECGLSYGSLVLLQNKIITILCTLVPWTYLFIQITIIIQNPLSGTQ